MEEWEQILRELRDELVLREEELKLLHDIDMQLLRSPQSLNVTLTFIVSKAQELLKSNLTAILLRRGNRLETAYSVNKAVLGQHLDIANSVTGLTLSSGQAINVPDVTAEPYARKYVTIRGYAGPPLRSLLAAPILVHRTFVGVISTESTRVNAFTPVHERVMKAIAGQVAVALQRAQLFQQDELFTEVDELIFTGQTAQEVSAAPEWQNVVPTALQKVMDALQVLEHVQLSGAAILFMRGEDELEVVHSTNPADVGIVLNVDQSICGQAVREKRTVLVGDVRSKPDYVQMRASGTRSEIAIPILLGSADFVIGVLNVESEEVDAFEGFCQVLLESFADKVRTLLAFAKLRADVTETMELRNASDLLVAVGDQASNMIHRMNNTVGAMRVRILELQDHARGVEASDQDFLMESLASLESLADQTLKMPEEISRLLNRQVVVNVNDVVRDVLGTIDMPAGVEVDLRLDNAMPRVPVYSLDIVVESLVQNALDAMPQGGLLSISTASVSHQDLASGYVELTVSDTGHGIPEDVLPRIFELNFSTKRAKGKGHRLGLWWIRNFVLRAKGTVSVSSSVGSGTEFVIKLPVPFTADATS
jgi:signal transduction histidine kinase